MTRDIGGQQCRGEMFLVNVGGVNGECVAGFGQQRLSGAARSWRGIRSGIRQNPRYRYRCGGTSFTWTARSPTIGSRLVAAGFSYLTWTASAVLAMTLPTVRGWLLASRKVKTSPLFRSAALKCPRRPQGSRRGERRHHADFCSRVSLGVAGAKRFDLVRRRRWGRRQRQRCLLFVDTPHNQQRGQHGGGQQSHAQLRNE